jgi:hypothetical protein
MAAAAHDADFADKVGILQGGARLFRADQRRARRHTIAKSMRKVRTPRP